QEIAKAQQSVAETRETIEQAKLVHEFLDELTSKNEGHRKLAIEAILMAIPEEGAKLVQIVSETDISLEVQRFAKSRLIGLKDSREAIYHITSSYLTQDYLNQLEIVLQEPLENVVTGIESRIRKLSSVDRSKNAYQFMTVPREANTIDLERDCPNHRCLVGAFNLYMTVFQDLSQSKDIRIEALKMVIGLTALVHQPMHVSFKDDFGGNRWSINFLGENTNLHAIWDGQLLAGVNSSTPYEWSKRLTKIYERSVSSNSYTNQDFIAWANESLLITHNIYKTTPKKKNLSWNYVDDNRITLEKLTFKAGLRLAIMLKSDYIKPVIEKLAKQ
ncbi:MAG: hypothetical protein ACI9YH_003213, partial [Colwellia sp.]